MGIDALNRVAKLAMATVSALMVTCPAAAQTVSGTVNITGSVAPKCLVLPGAGNSFGTLVSLGELAQTDGRLATNLASRFSSIGGAGLTARVVCTSANPTVSVDAQEITTATPVVAGYTNRIDFAARVAVSLTPSGTDIIGNDSRNAATGPTALSGRLANNGNGNMSITADTFGTANTNDLLVAGAYTGRINIIIAPGV